jgi:O-acetyl-ADP-ribose deacetylase (regulator of RNase III)
MLLYVNQNIFESPAQVIVNAVNTVGVMGKGIAKKYKQLYPEMYKQYRYFCEHNMLEIGKLWLYEDETKWVLSFPTKDHWRNPSELEYIELGLKKFVKTYEAKGIHSISFPQLGTGNGGLDWENEVKPLFEKYLRPLPIPVFVHIVDEKSTFQEHENIAETKEWLQKDPGALSVDFIWEDLIHTLEKQDWKVHHWQVNIEAEKLKLSIQKGDTIEFYKEDLYDLWIKLRDFGYLFAHDFPENYRINRRAQKILKLLTILPYIEPIQAENQQNQFVGVSIRKIDLPQKDGPNQLELLPI